MILLLENSTSHTAKDVVKVIFSLFAIVLFLSQYSSLYAPVKIYSLCSKINLWEIYYLIQNNLHTKFGQEDFKKAPKKIGFKEINRMWQHYYLTIS